MIADKVLFGYRQVEALSSCSTVLLAHPHMVP